MSLHESRYLRRHMEEPFYLAVAKGQVRGHSLVHKFGYNADMDAANQESIWSYGGLYNWSAWGDIDTGSSLFIKSDDAADTGTVELQGLDVNGNFMTQVVTLNGTTAVQLSTDMYRVYRMIYSKGAGDVNEGDITLHTDSSTGSVVAHISPNDSQTLMAIYTIPKGHTGYILDSSFSCEKNKGGQFRMFQRQLGGSFRSGNVVEMFENNWVYKSTCPLVMPELTDIDARCYEATNNNMRASCTFDILLVDNNYL